MFFLFVCSASITPSTDLFPIPVIAQECPFHCLTPLSMWLRLKAKRSKSLPTFSNLRMMFPSLHQSQWNVMRLFLRLVIGSCSFLPDLNLEDVRNCCNQYVGNGTEKQRDPGDPICVSDQAVPGVHSIPSLSSYINQISHFLA